MDANMLWDSPLVTNIALPARTCKASTDKSASFVDGTYDAPGGARIGYRLMPHPEPVGASGAKRPVLVHFHGNAELAAEYLHSVSTLHKCGVSLLAVDFRGYGWSTGTPRMSALADDAAALLPALPGILKKAKLEDAPLILFGRSIGSVCAIHLASKHGDAFQGLVLESAIGNLLDLPMVQQLAQMMPGAAMMLQQLQHSSASADPFNNVRKMKAVTLPLLVIHGVHDQISPFSQGQLLLDTCASSNKQLCRLVAGHNDLTYRTGKMYYRYVKDFVAMVTKADSSAARPKQGAAAAAAASSTSAGATGATGAGGGAGAGATATSADVGAGGAPAGVDVDSMSVKDMKRLLDAHGIGYADVLQKAELRRRVRKALSAADAAEALPAAASGDATASCAADGAGHGRASDAPKSKSSDNSTGDGGASSTPGAASEPKSAEGGKGLCPMQ